MNCHAIKKAAEDFDMSIPAAIKIRIRYLLGLIDLWLAYIDEQTNVTPESDMMACIDEIIRLRAYEVRLKRGITNKDAITDEQIQAARDYPIERMFEFVRGRTQCPFHDSKGPDLSYHAKTNTVRCFGSCGKSWDTIRVCMDRDGLTFFQAVKYLSNG